MARRVMDDPSSFTQLQGDLRVPAKGAGRCVESLGGRSGHVPVWQDEDIERSTVASRLDSTGQRLGAAVKHPSDDADGVNLRGTLGSVRTVVVQHALPQSNSRAVVARTGTRRKWRATDRRREENG
jgi:hypothetical protein